MYIATQHSNISYTGLHIVGYSKLRVWEVSKQYSKQKKNVTSRIWFRKLNFKNHFEISDCLLSKEEKKRCAIIHMVIKTNSA